LGGLITQYLHWQYCFWVLLAHGALMLILTWQFPETLKMPISLHTKTMLAGYWHALKNSRLIIFSLTAGLVSAISY